MPAQDRSCWEGLHGIRNKSQSWPVAHYFPAARCGPAGAGPAIHGRAAGGPSLGRAATQTTMAASGTRPADAQPRKVRRTSKAW
jgi:hypothetical protein